MLTRSPRLPTVGPRTIAVSAEPRSRRGGPVIVLHARASTTPGALVRRVKGTRAALGEPAGPSLHRHRRGPPPPPTPPPPSSSQPTTPSRSPSLAPINPASPPPSSLSPPPPPPPPLPPPPPRPAGRLRLLAPGPRDEMPRGAGPWRKPDWPVRTSFQTPPRAARAVAILRIALRRMQRATGTAALRRARQRRARADGRGEAGRS